MMCQSWVDDARKLDSTLVERDSAEMFFRLQIMANSAIVPNISVEFVRKVKKAKNTIALNLLISVTLYT